MLDTTATAARPGAGGSTALPTSRSWRVRSAFPRSAKCRMRRHRRPRRRHHCRRHFGLDLYRPSAEIESPMPSGYGFARAQAQYAALRDRPCVTKDGRVELMINAASDRPAHMTYRQRRHRAVPHRVAVHGRPELPRSSDNCALSYRVDAAGSKPVTFRTPIGGDKALPNEDRGRGKPALAGGRSARLDRGLLRGQIRALLRAVAARAEDHVPGFRVAEFDQAKAIVEREDLFAQHGHALPEGSTSAHGEVPAMLYQLDEL